MWDIEKIKTNPSEFKKEVEDHLTKNICSRIQSDDFQKSLFDQEGNDNE